jgi:hypothetical protein
MMDFGGEATGWKPTRKGVCIGKSFKYLFRCGAENAMEVNAISGHYQSPISKELPVNHSNGIR